ncbi:MAG: hypothetical protein ACM3XO_27755, partial [Bacteroidota bacterium]
RITNCFPRCQAHPFTMESVVILPDQLHCIWTLTGDDDDFSTRWRQIKAAFSRQLPRTGRRYQSRSIKEKRSIWHDNERAIVKELQLESASAP